MMLQDSPLPLFDLVRVPGEFGPILRCRGELSMATVGALRHELDLLEPLGHPVLTLDLSECDFLDVDGIATLLESFKRLREKGQRLVVVAGTGPPARLLDATGIDWIIPVFPTHAVAALALRGAAPAAHGPATWAEAREKTLARWRRIQAAVGQQAPEETLRLLTSMMGFCERSEELFQERRAKAEVRCQFCPLFSALGGRSEDIGCRSILEPIIEAVREGLRESAGAQVAKVIRLIEEMPLPERDLPAPPERLLSLTTRQR
jgi:anti-anti-sigma factor